MNRDRIRSILGVAAIAAIATVPAACGALSVGTTLATSADAIGTLVKQAMDDEPKADEAEKTASVAPPPQR